MHGSTTTTVSTCITVNTGTTGTATCNATGTPVVRDAIAGPSATSGTGSTSTTIICVPTLG
jgi:hypothetical protein